MAAAIGEITQYAAASKQHQRSGGVSRIIKLTGDANFCHMKISNESG